MYRGNSRQTLGMHTFETYSNYSSAFESKSADANTRVTYKGGVGDYFKRVGGGIVAVPIGFILLLAAFPVLFWNERRAVRRTKTLNEGLKLVSPLSSIDNIFESNNGQLIHLSGKIYTPNPLTDDDFGVCIYATHLKRDVEMYQWVEQKHETEHKETFRTRVETNFSYGTEWRSDIVNSSSFANSNYSNPNAFPVSAYSKTADLVCVGVFQLSPTLKSSISNFEAFHPTSKPEWRDDLVIHEHFFYRCFDPYRPVVGDLRMAFSFAGLSLSDPSNIGAPMDVSIVACQNGNMLSSYTTKAGGSLQILYEGIMTPKEMFEAQHKENKYLTWGIRLGGWLMMLIGIWMMLDFVRVIVSFIPIVREIVGLAAFLVAFTFSTALSLIVIAIGWVVYRPILAAAIICVGFAAAVPLVYALHNKEQKENE